MKTFLEIRKKNQDRYRKKVNEEYSDKYFKRFIKRLSRKIIWTNRFGGLTLEVEHINLKKFKSHFCSHSIETALMETGLFGEENVFTVVCLESIGNLRISWAIDWNRGEEN